MAAGNSPAAKQHHGNEDGAITIEQGDEHVAAGAHAAARTRRKPTVAAVRWPADRVVAGHLAREESGS